MCLHLWWFVRFFALQWIWLHWERKRGQWDRKKCDTHDCLIRLVVACITRVCIIYAISYFCWQTNKTNERTNLWLIKKNIISHIQRTFLLGGQTRNTLLHANVFPFRFKSANATFMAYLWIHTRKKNKVLHTLLRASSSFFSCLFFENCKMITW